MAAVARVLDGEDGLTMTQKTHRQPSPLSPCTDCEGQNNDGDGEYLTRPPRWIPPADRPLPSVDACAGCPGVRARIDEAALDRVLTRMRDEVEDPALAEEAEADLALAADEGRTVPGKRATEAQMEYLWRLTEPEELAAMPLLAASWLIGFLVGPPPNATRAQQLYLLGLVGRLSRKRLSALISKLASVERRRSPTKRKPRRAVQNPLHTTRDMAELFDSGDIDSEDLPF